MKNSATTYLRSHKTISPDKCFISFAKAGCQMSIIWLRDTLSKRKTERGRVQNVDQSFQNKKYWSQCLLMKPSTPAIIQNVWVIALQKTKKLVKIYPLKSYDIHWEYFVFYICAFFRKKRDLLMRRNWDKATKQLPNLSNLQIKKIEPVVSKQWSQ